MFAGTEVPEAVQESIEFREACPASAVVMHRRAGGASKAPVRVLFVCTANSARSQIAHEVFNRKAGGRFVAESAGSHPADRVHPRAIQTLERHGYKWTDRPPRDVAALGDAEWDLVITVCDRAREACPIVPGRPITAHWGIPDPAAVQGSDAEKQRAFDEAFLTVSRRVDLLLSLPIEKLTRPELGERVRAIGLA